MSADHERGFQTASWTIRAATWVGHSIGRWQRHRAAQRDEAFVRRWQRAWLAGRDARWGGVARDAVPYRRSIERRAWLAGWLWGDTQPDRRNALRPDRRAQPRDTVPRRAVQRLAPLDRDSMASGGGRLSS
jgi:hypothetical protein